MDNEFQYGPEFHRLSFAKAVEADLLSDYKVTILAMSEKQIARDYQGLLSEGEALADVGRVIGCLNGLAKIDPQGMEFKDDPETDESRCLRFSNTIKESQHFVGLVEREQDEAALAERKTRDRRENMWTARAACLKRDRLLAWLREDMDYGPALPRPVQRPLSNRRDRCSSPRRGALLAAAQVPNRRCAGSRTGDAESGG